MHRKQISGPSAPYSARLVRLLANLGSPEAVEIPGCFAERMGRLFDLADTIALDAARQRPAAGPFIAESDTATHLQADLDHSRDSLVERIDQAFSDGGTATLRLPTPVPDETPPSFKPYQRFYLAQQRQLIATVQPLRLRIRQTMAAHSPALAQLAALDTVFDNTLSIYSRRGFATLPKVLEKRFKTLWRAHLKDLSKGDRDPHPGDWITPGAWLHQFHQEMRMMLLAELEIRLEPILGLLDALNHKDHNLQ